ncbi:MAG: hypothetical protein ACRDP6_10540 [Actinoallomurus sp.]
MSDTNQNVTRLPEVDGYDDLTDFDAEGFLEEWQEADRAAVKLLREALPNVVSATAPADALAEAVQRIRAHVAEWPHRHLAAAADWGKQPPADDETLWIQAAGALVSMNGESGLGSHEESSLMTLQHGDWAGAVVGLARGGAGTRAWPEDLFKLADNCPEIEGSYETDDREPIEFAFGLIVPIWEAVGALDEHRRLTALGHWGLPRALAWAWDGSMDEE